MKLEQLENKIRQLVPSLMELSFGCKVIWKDDEGDLNESILIRIYNDFYYGIFEENFNKEQIIEILGHPIQLHHVLFAVDKAYKELATTCEGGMLEREKREYIHTAKYWDLTKDLSGQSEETIEFISNLINK